MLFYRINDGIPLDIKTDILVLIRMSHFHSHIVGFPINVTIRISSLYLFRLINVIIVVEIIKYILVICAKCHRK